MFLKKTGLKRGVKRTKQENNSGIHNYKNGESRVVVAPTVSHDNHVFNGDVPGTHIIKFGQDTYRYFTYIQTFLFYIMRNFITKRLLIARKIF